MQRLCLVLFGSETADLPAGKASSVLQPLSRPPARYSEAKGSTVSPEALLPPVLFVDLRNVQARPLL